MCDMARYGVAPQELSLWKAMATVLAWAPGPQVSDQIASHLLEPGPITTSQKLLQSFCNQDSYHYHT
jgi:hypothetical protein